MTAAPAMHPDRVWLRQYPKGVPSDIDADSVASVAAMLEDAFQRYAALPAFSCLGGTLSYADVDRLSAAFASYLQHDLQLRRGDRVAIMMPNLLAYPVALFGVLRAGLCVVNVNPLYTPREVEHQLCDAGARVLVVVENFCHTVQAALPKLPVERVIVARMGDLLPSARGWVTNLVVRRVRKLVPAWKIADHVRFTDALERGATRPFRRETLNRQDLAFLQYTGGTTGRAKGAQLSHGNILANVLQIRAWIGPAMNTGDEPECIVTALPLYHVFALTVNCLTFVTFGGRNLLITDPRDMKGFVKQLSQNRISAITGVNTLFNGLLNQPDFAKLNFSGLRLVVGGGAAVLKATAERWHAVTGTRLVEGYGLTETSPVVCFTPIDKLEWSGSIGLPLPSTWVVIRDDDNRDVPVGHPGELCVKGPQVMSGYWQRSEETAAAFTADGYLRTGDIATMDERGFFTIVDRKKDMIIVSGFNVYPNEVENVVAQHPGVLECACVGVPDENTGEAVKVFVVKKDPTLTPEELRRHCKQSLTNYKVPRQIEFRDQLPKSPIGKILRKELRSPS